MLWAALACAPAQQGRGAVAAPLLHAHRACLYPAEAPALPRLPRPLAASLPLTHCVASRPRPPACARLHPRSPAVLQMDMRQPDAASVPAWTVSADVEALAWDPHTPTQFVVAAEDGAVACYDARQVGGAQPSPVHPNRCASFCLQPAGCQAGRAPLWAAAPGAGAHCPLLRPVHPRALLCPP